jgi:hypothetical protein
MTSEGRCCTGKTKPYRSLFVELFQYVRTPLAEISKSIVILVIVVTRDDSNLGNLLVRGFLILVICG